MIKTFFILCLLIISATLPAEKLEMSIRFIGLKVVNVSMTDSDNEVTVHAQTTGIGTFASEMDNTYISKYSGDYLPDRYTKIINQKDYSENRITEYDREQLTASRISYFSESRNLQYDIMSTSRDFFSALYFLRYHWQDKKRIYLDANGLIWAAECNYLGEDLINTVFGRTMTSKVEVIFKKLSSQQKERSDMLTNNLVNEDNTLILWISKDERRLPLKARYCMNPFSVYWVLESYVQ